MIHNTDSDTAYLNEVNVKLFDCRLEVGNWCSKICSQPEFFGFLSVCLPPWQVYGSAATVPDILLHEKQLLMRCYLWGRDDSSIMDITCHFRPVPVGGQQWEGTLPVRPFPCRSCHKSFNTLSGRKYHENSMHKKVYKYICNLCNKGYQCRSNYRGHMASHFSHLGEKCRKCGASFTFRGNRQRHEARCQRGGAVEAL